MSIPRVIHYCWFGGNPKGRMIKKCIRSWRKYCPDYEIIEWNESNFDVNAIPYTAEAYACKKWAFVSDYARLKIVYEHGGIYLDTDVELVKPLDPLLSYGGFFGFEKMGTRYQTATGLGFGAVSGHPLVRKLMESYDELSFLKEDGLADLMPCPERDTELLKREGLKTDNQCQMIGDVIILPTEYLCPADYITGRITKTKNTISIHHYQATWLDETNENVGQIKKIAKNILGRNRYIAWREKKKKIYSAILRRKK